MGKYNKNDFSFEIEEFIGVLKENDKHDWCKAGARITWNDNPTTIDIRNMNISQNKVMKGISLSDEETDRLVDILLEHDYGSMEALVKAIERKKSRFTVSSNIESFTDSDEPYTINVKLD